MEGQVVKLTSGVGSARNILILREDANTTADGDGSSLVVTWNLEEKESIERLMQLRCKAQIYHHKRADGLF